MRDPRTIRVLEPTEWIGKAIPIAPELVTAIDLSQDATLLLYHHDCPACMHRLRDLETLARAGRRVVLIELPPFSRDTEHVSQAAGCMKVRLHDKVEWIVSTPVSIELEHGIVRRVW